MLTTTSTPARSKACSLNGTRCSLAAFMRAAGTAQVAVAILQEAAEATRPAPDAPVFASATGKPLSNMAMTMLLRRMDYGQYTAHGFRSTFRDWAAERTAYPNEVVEMALAHSIGSKVEAAYRRGDLFDKRRRLMDDWAKYCDTLPAAAGGEVVPLRKA